MEKQYDVVVIGTGSGASVVASRCRAAGWTVAIIDARPFGGTCALRGCHPKKMLVSAGEAIDAVHRMTGKGVRSHEVGIDWAALMRFKRTDTDPAPAFFEQSFAQAGIEAFHGRARFVGPTSVAVGDAVLHGTHVVVATGAKPTALPFPGAEYLTLSDAFLDLEALPRRLLFVGGGYIAFEFAHVAVRAGAEVTILAAARGRCRDSIRIWWRCWSSIPGRWGCASSSLRKSVALSSVAMGSVSEHDRRPGAPFCGRYGGAWGGTRPRNRRSGSGNGWCGARTARGDGQRLLAERVEPGRVCGWGCGGQRTAADADGRP